MKWEEYPPQVRQIIGQTWMEDKYPDLFKNDCINVVITSGEEIVRKETVLEDVLFQLYGAPADYFTDKFDWTYFSDLNETITTNRKLFQVGRNDPCPCGSGVKYKKCCGK